MSTTVIELATAEAPLSEPTVASPDGVYVYNEAMVDEAINNLIMWFRRPRTAEMIRVLVGQVQGLEDVYYQLMGAFDVDTAVGDQLDKLGLNVGELRDDRTDEPFRAAIRTRVLVNSSEGTLPELLAILEAAVPTIAVATAEYYPASLVFRWTDAFAGVSPSDLMALIRRAKPAGVNVQAIVANPTTGFRFSATADAGAATTQAFASTTTPGDGGELVRVL